MFDGIQIKGVSVAVPKEKLEFRTLGEIYGDKYVDRVCAVTGISGIRVAPKGKTASDYCITAAEQLFADLAFDKSKIDAIIFISQSPDYIIPHTSAIMQAKLNLRNSIAAFDLNFGCPGYVFGLLQAHSMISSGLFNSILLCCGDTLTHYINPEDKALRLVMGDGGSATLIEKSGHNTADFSFYTDGSRYDKLCLKAGASRMPKENGVTNVMVIDDDGNKRSAEDLFMDGLEVMSFALSDVKSTINSLLDKLKWTKDDIDLLGLHQANAMIVKYVAKSLKIKMNKTPIAVDGYGNTSSCSIPLMLCSIYGDCRYNEMLNKVLLCGFGTGLSCAACGVNLSETYFGKIIEI